jgi:hypothetical protein
MSGSEQELVRYSLYYVDSDSRRCYYNSSVRFNDPLFSKGIDMVRKGIKVTVLPAHKLPIHHILHDELANVIRIEYDGKVMLEESDLLEPEEATYDNALAWVATVIEQVYTLGLVDGSEQARAEFNHIIDSFESELATSLSDSDPNIL